MPTRVPTSPTPIHSGWSLETAIDYLLGILHEKQATFQEKHNHVVSVIDGNDRRYEQRFVATALATDAALQAAKEAVLKAESASEKRFESVNEFRNTLADQQRNLMPRAEVDAIVKGLTDKIAANGEKISDLQSRLNALQSERVGLKGGWAIAVAVAGFVAVIAALVVRFAP